MPEPLLLTKLYVPLLQPNIVLRPRLIERLNEGLSGKCKLTLISAPAGFGKTTLVSEWIASPWHCPPGQVLDRPVAWLSLDEGDSDPARFLIYLIAALQNISSTVGEGILFSLQTPQPLLIEALLTTLLNEISAIPDNFILVLEDYHMIDSEPIDHALTFLLEHLPSQMHLIITTREDPQIPLARFRARGQLTELRAADLRFTPAETADFLNQVMGLNLSTDEVSALETRTEGWIAGLQLAAISMQGHEDTASFIKSFTGSHHFVLDFLIEEVLQQQPENIQTFLLQTSILDRMCGPLCDAVLRSPCASGQETLEYLEHANLFIVPLDNERRWYRYHHLFTELLRLRLGKPEEFADYHIRASQWYEDHGLELEAFQHAAAANDIERAERIIEGKGLPLHYRGALVPVLNWLASLPKTDLDAKPSLGVMCATLTLMTGKTVGVEEKLCAAEASIAAALQGREPVGKTRDLIGQIAAARATLALTRYQPEAMITQAHRALEYLHPDNLSSRVRAIWTLGFAYQVQGDRAAARQSYTEAIAISQASGNTRFTIVATISLAVIQELDNHLYQAVETYRSGLQLAGDHPQPFENEGYLGLARILYEWNDLEGAEQHGLQALQLARRFDRVIDRDVICEVFLARLKLTNGDVGGAAAMLAETEHSVRQNNFVNRIPEVAAAQVLILLRQDDLAAADHLAQSHDLPFCLARVHLAQGDPSAALVVLETLRQQMEARGWVDECLKVMVLQSVALNAHGEKDKSVQLLGEALRLAEPGGFIRLFVDEGEVMAQLLLEEASLGVMPNYVGKLLIAFEAEKQKSKDKSDLFHALPAGHRDGEPLFEPLSQRELEVLKLLRRDLSGPEIAQQLSVSINTFRTHTKNIFIKLGANDRRAAIRRAEERNII